MTRISQSEMMQSHNQGQAQARRGWVAGFMAVIFSLGGLFIVTAHAAQGRGADVQVIVLESTLADQEVIAAVTAPEPVEVTEVKETPKVTKETRVKTTPAKETAKETTKETTRPKPCKRDMFGFCEGEELGS